MQTTTLKAPDIECDGCANAIKKALGKLPDISGIEVNIETKEVTVQHESTVFHETLLKTLDKAGFPVLD